MGTHIVDDLDDSPKGRGGAFGLGEASETQLGAVAVFEDDEELDDERDGPDAEMVGLGHSRRDEVLHAVELDVSDTEPLPIAQQPHQLLASAPTTNLQTQTLGSRLDMQEASEPVALVVLIVARNIAVRLRVVMGGVDGRSGHIVRSCSG